MVWGLSGDRGPGSPRALVAGNLLTPCTAARMYFLHPDSHVPSSRAVFLSPGLVSALSSPVKVFLTLGFGWLITR